MLFKQFRGIVCKDESEICVRRYEKFFLFVSSSLHIEFDTVFGRDFQSVKDQIRHMEFCEIHRFSVRKVGVVHLSEADL